MLGDAFLKFAVGRHLFLLHDKLDEGQLTRKRSNLVNNSNLCKLAKKSKLQVIGVIFVAILASQLIRVVVVEIILPPSC